MGKQYDNNLLINKNWVYHQFPASRGLSRRGKNERRERPLPASDALFDEGANQISGRNLPVFKTGSVYCVTRLPHETNVCFLFFHLLLLSLKFDSNIISVYSWGMLLIPGTGNGERGTGNGERGTGNRERESGN